MERQYFTRKPTDLEKEKYTYIERDEKDIPLGTFEPVEILQYRGYNIPIYADDYSQEFFIRFNNEEWANPTCYYDDFCDFLDSKLDMFVPDKNPNQIVIDLYKSNCSLLNIIRCGNNNSNIDIYLNAKELEKNIDKYIYLFQFLANIIEIQENTKDTSGKKYLIKLRTDIFIDDILLEQIKRAIENLNRKEGE